MATQRRGPNQETALKHKPEQSPAQGVTNGAELLSPAAALQQAATFPSTLKPDEILTLQRSVGNQSVHKLVTVTQINRQEASRDEKLAAYEAAVTAEDWGQVAVRLNGFNDADIARLLGRLLRAKGADTLRKIYTAALQKMPGWSERVHLPIERLINISSATGYVGLNPKANIEASALKNNASGKVITSLDNPAGETALSTPDGRKAFVEQLGIPAADAKFALVLKCLEECDEHFREQMADMIRMFRDAELGKYRLERLVLSGHHAGDTMWGDSNAQHSPGDLQPGRELQNLANAFPGAAAQIEDVMFSACNSVNEVDVCKNAFPKLQTVWVYEGYSPRVDQGSSQHILQWERKTRGRGVPTRRDRMGNAVIWTKNTGFIPGAGGTACGP